ncbi:MAG: hypothetical protein J6Y16_00085 [Treponema sp.]|nr:hypothetical protein [Treponema sp.]
MKLYSISIFIFSLIFLFVSCTNKGNEQINCSYSDILLENFESTNEEMKKNKDKDFYISGIIKKIDRPKDQPLLNECVIYFYDDKIFDEKAWVGKFVSIKVKPLIEQDLVGKPVTIKCKYKVMSSMKLDEDYNNYFCVKFKNGILIDK